MSAGGLHESTVHRLEAQSMHFYLRAVKRQREGACRVAISSDAARLGDPAEETLCCQAWVAERNLGVVLPPQVPLWASLEHEKSACA
eukprot:6492108-Amphidinium_carterae.1